MAKTCGVEKKDRNVLAEELRSGGWSEEYVFSWLPTGDPLIRRFKVWGLPQKQRWRFQTHQPGLPA
jgi:hypothetical protein